MEQTDKAKSEPGVPAGPGHNSGDVMVTVETRLFNSLSRFAPSGRHVKKLTVPAGTNIAEILKLLQVPPAEVFVALKNGRDITPGLVGAPINTFAELEDGDIIAFSGPVPYSYGYGAPVV